MSTGMSLEQIAAADWRILVAGGVALVVALLTLRSVIRRAVRGRQADDVLATVAMLIGLGWSSEVMWEIARNTIQLSIAVTLMLFFLFEVALLVSMIRAKKHMQRTQWTGRAGTTAWGLATFMALVGVAAGTTWPERMIRAAAPFVVTKLWYDGVVGDAKKPDAEETDWTITADRVLRALRLKRARVTTQEQLVARMTQLEFLRRYGIQKWGFPVRRAFRLRELALQADDAVIAEVRRRVTRANWFTVTPLTQAPDAAVTHLGDAPAPPASRPAARPLTSRDAGDADPATQAALLVQLEGLTQREAARRTGADPTTVRRRLSKMTQPDASPDAPRTNGHDHRLTQAAT